MDDRQTQLQVEAWLSSFGSANTRAAYRNDVAVFVAWCGAQRISPVRANAETVERFRQELIATGAALSTANRRASAVHGFVRSAIGPEPGRDGAPTPSPTPTPTPPAGGAASGQGASTTVALTEAERDQVLAALPRQAPKAQVLVALLLLDGLKLDEVLALDADDVAGRPPRLEVRVTRGEVSQVLELHPTTSALAAAHLAGRSSGPLLGGRGEPGSRLSRFGADYLVKRAGRDAGLAAPLTTNVLRRTYVGHAHDAGDDVDDIRQRVGHRDARTTRRYLPDASPR
jgi:integrase